MTQPLNIISNQLDILIKLNAILLVNIKDKGEEKIEFLSTFGLKNYQIAKILGKTPENISSTLWNIRQKEKELSKEK